MTIGKIAFRILSVLIVVPLTCIIGIYLNYHFISFMVNNQLISNAKDVNYTEFTLVFGSGNYRPQYWTNYTLLNRSKAVDELIKLNKTNKVIISGRKSGDDNDETEDMKNVLSELGTDTSNLILDTLGFRTWTSVANAKKMVNGKKVLMVSQKEQLERALFISNCTNVEAVGLIAKPVPSRQHNWSLREYMARVKCMYDCILYKLNLTVN